MTPPSETAATEARTAMPARTQASANMVVAMVLAVVVAGLLAYIALI